MQGDSVHSVDGLSRWEERVRELQTASVRLCTRRDSVKADLAEKKAHVQKLSGDVELLTKAGELLRLLMDKLVLDQVRTIESVVTEGLKSIFFDQDLAFQAEVGTYRNKVAIDLLIKRESNGIEIVGPPLESTGGGVSSIASLTLRILALLRLKKFPILLLDETLSAVSDDYVDATGQFLGKLAEKTNIPILLVTHKQAFLDHAKNAYQGFEETNSDGSMAMGLKRLRGSK